MSWHCYMCGEVGPGDMLIDSDAWLAHRKSDCPKRILDQELPRLAKMARRMLSHAKAGEILRYDEPGLTMEWRRAET